MTVLLSSSVPSFCLAGDFILTISDKEAYKTHTHTQREREREGGREGGREEGREREREREIDKERRQTDQPTYHILWT